MTIYYLSSVDGDNLSDGLSWANAYATFKYAVETASAAASGPHIVYVDSAHSESLAADMTTTAVADIRVVSVDRAGGDSPLAGAVVGAQATNYAINLVGAFRVYIYGVTFQNGTNTSATKHLYTAQTDGAHWEYEACRWNINGTSGSRLYIGGTAIGSNYYSRFTGCDVKFSNAAHTILLHAGTVEFYGLTIDPAGTALTTTFTPATGGGDYYFEGCDFSDGASGNLVADASTSGTARARFLNCKLGTGMVPLTAAANPLNRGATTVWMYNCGSGDTHYNFYHKDAFGSTTAQTTIYATAGAQTNGVGVGYQVVTTANCSYFTPYVGPWLARPWTGTSAVTPSFEILRDGSATAYQDDEVWGEWSYQGTTGYPLASFVNDRMALLGTAANQGTGALAAGDWTGENATAWFGKLAPASTITPAEAGCIYGRVVVGEPSTTVYYDPQIRVA